MQCRRKKSNGANRRERRRKRQKDKEREKKRYNLMTRRAESNRKIIMEETEEREGKGEER